MKPTLQKKHSLLILSLALAAAFVPLALIIMQVTGFTKGIFIYPVDDTFIHMQVAKNVAMHGTWGVNAGVFGSASSSLLYTLILSVLFKLFGTQLYLPLIINAVAAIFLLLAVHRWLRAQMLTAGAQLLVLLLVVFFAPLPILVLSGMEHTLQCLFSFLFLASFSEWMGAGDGRARRLPWKIILWAVLTCTIRYEGFFLVGGACLALAARRQWMMAFQLGILAALPAVIFGIYSVTQGSYMLPNSVLIKSEAAQFSVKTMMQSAGRILIEKFTLATAGITQLATQRLLLLLPLLYLAFAPFIRLHRSYGYFLGLLLFATAAHLAFADTGKFYRYEAYLVTCSVIITTVLLIRSGRELLFERKGMRLLLFVFLFFLAFPVVLRSTAAFSKAKQACINIYEQQYQMAQFVHRYYNTDGLAANDIGAVSYFTQTQLLDLWGLASIEVARSKKGGYWTAPFLDSLSRQRGTRLAIIYDSWIGSSIPPRWKKAGAWTIPNNVVCGDNTVYFYAVDTSAFAGLKKNLAEYKSSLPAEVGVTDYP